MVLFFQDSGILKNIKGEKLGKNLIIIPKESLKEALKVFHELKINYSLKEIFEL